MSDLELTSITLTIDGKEVVRVDADARGIRLDPYLSRRLRDGRRSSRRVQDREHPQVPPREGEASIRRAVVRYSRSRKASTPWSE